MNPVSRRTALKRSLAATAGLVGLAGCSGGGGGGDGGDGGGGETTTQSGATVEVGPNGEFVFRPGTDEPLRVSAGTTVTWVWQSDTHNIYVDSQPESADWQGTPGGKSETYDEGYTYEHEFTVPGEYHYWCVPHKSAGMVADLVVEE